MKNTGVGVFFLIFCLALNLPGLLAESRHGSDRVTNPESLTVSQKQSSNPPESPIQSPEQRVILATSDPLYPVTPGDVYRIWFDPGNQPVAIFAIVQSDYSVDLGVIGTLDAQDLLYSEFRRKLQRWILDAYPGSQPIIQIESTGIFSVIVSGEVEKTFVHESWGLSRLGKILDGNTVEDASLRDIEIISSSGISRRFDLFRSQRFGEMDQNPFVKPGDRIIVHPALKEVELSGEVRRPGVYQLLPGEGLAELIDFYGNGLRPLANLQDVRITRRLAENRNGGKELYVSLEEIDRGVHYELFHLDRVHIDSRERLRPFVFVEGAIGHDININAQQVSPESSKRLDIQIRPDTRLSSILRIIEDEISDVSDLENAYVLRDGDRIAVNLRHYLYEDRSMNDFLMMANDRLVIPFKQMFISVGGAVHRPGRYPYIQDRGWEYYAMLAGGIDRDRNRFDSVSIRRFDGRRKSTDEPLEPEDSIYIRSDSPIHVLIRTGQIVGPLASTAAVIIGLLNLR